MAHHNGRYSLTNYNSISRLCPCWTIYNKASFVLMKAIHFTIKVVRLRHCRLVMYCFPPACNFAICLQAHRKRTPDSLDFLPMQNILFIKCICCQTQSLCIVRYLERHPLRVILPFLREFQKHFLLIQSNSCNKVHFPCGFSLDLA